jgi:predicted dehydrogenase
MIRVAVIGAGLIGRERLAAVSALVAEGKPVTLVGVYDAQAEVCSSTATAHATTAHHSIPSLLAERPDWVMIALPHDSAVEAATKVLSQGVSVLLEKPMGRDLVEAARLLELGGHKLYIGFNYRFYRGIAKALEDLRSGRFGKTISIEFNLGHGSAPGQEHTWKLDAMRAGGGCLIDPGVHLLDLCLQFAPNGLRVVGGTSWSGFWKTGIEEEVSLILEADGFSITIRISVVSWKSTFFMRINGTDGYGIITGRNRSYGKQKYIVGRRWGWLDSPSQVDSELIELVDDGLDVFKLETEALLFGGNEKLVSPRLATAEDGYAVMKLLDDIRAALGLRRDYSN